MNKKAKGTTAERDLVHRFWASEGWVAHRIAGSGSSKYPSPDIIASNNLRKLVIECKFSKDKSVYIPKKEIGELQKFGNMFGAEIWIGVKLNGLEWHFVSVEDMNETGNNYGINLEIIKNKGFLFEELIK